MISAIPIIVSDEMRAKAEQRIGSKDGCWLWIGKRQRNGYGKLTFKGREYRAHRVIYTIARGPIPDGLDLDHLCRNPTCVNPAHLEPVTRGENTKRGTAYDRIRTRRQRITVCNNGHDYTGANRRANGNGGMYCAECQRLKCARRRARIKAERPSI